MALEPHSAPHSLPPHPADLPSVDHLLLDGPVEREMHLLQLQVCRVQANDAFLREIDQGWKIKF